MDSFINRIFKNKVLDEAKMMKFGFKSKGDNFIYISKILDGQFILTVTVKGVKKLETKLVDASSNDVYTLHLIDEAVGTFVGKVREEYERVLNKISEKCCNDTYFMSEQANRISSLIKQKYGDTPEFLWEKFPGFGVFRNPDSGKWYGLISRVDFSKLDKSKKGEVEILNIKLDEEEVIQLQKTNGFYPAYHMNKKSWITAVLDDTIFDAELMKLIEKSHVFSQGKRKLPNNKMEWLIPANPKYFDLDDAFRKNKIIIWKQSSNVTVGNIVYLYVGAPVSAVRYRCEVIEVNIPYDYEDENLKINKVMRIKLLEKYDKNFLPFKILNNYGVNAVRGPRNIPQILSDYINKKR